MDSSRPESDAQLFIRELSEIFGDLRDQLAVIGGVAYNFWREPRYTNDIDFNVVADAHVIGEIRQRLIAHGYETVVNRRRTLLLAPTSCASSSPGRGR